MSEIFVEEILELHTELVLSDGCDDPECHAEEAICRECNKVFPCLSVTLARREREHQDDPSILYGWNPWPGWLGWFR